MPVAVYDSTESIDIDAPIGKGSAFLQAAQRLPILRKFNIICKFEVGISEGFAIPVGYKVLQCCQLCAR